MFKTLNPFMLIVIDSIPITDIQPGSTPEKTFVYLDPKREENQERTELRVTWSEFCKIHFKAKVNNRERVVTVPDILLEYMGWVLKEVNSWRETPARPWDPDSSIRCWFSPYLRVADMEELKRAINEDITLLRSMRE